MLGASAVQVGTAVMLEGRQAAARIISELESWFEDHGISSIDEVKGKALNNLKSFDEMKIEPAVSTVNGVPCTEHCDKCISACLYGAVRRERDIIKVDKTKCTGCGVCTFICPAKKLKLDW